MTLATNKLTTQDLFDDKGHLDVLERKVVSINKALKDTVDRAAAMNKVLNGTNVNNSADQNKIRRIANETDKLAKAQELYNQSLTETAKEIEKVKAATAKQNLENKQAAKLANAIKGSEEALAAQYAINTNRLRNMTIAQTIFTKEGRELVKVTRDQYNELKRLQSQRGPTTLNVGNYGSGLKQFAAQLVGFGGAALAAANLFRRAFTTIKDFDQGLAELSSLTGVVGKDLEFLGESAVELSQRFGIASVEMLRVFKLVGSARPELLQNTEALVKVADAAQILAKAAGVDVDSAVKSLALTMAQFNLTSVDSNKIIDVLATGAQKGAAEIGDLNAALENSGDTANAVGLSFETTVAALEAMAAGGVKGSEAGIKLRNILLVLASTGRDDLNPALTPLPKILQTLNDELGLQTDKANAASKAEKLFEKQTVAAALALINQRNVLENLDGTLDQHNNALSQAETNSNTLTGEVAKLSATWDKFILKTDSGKGVISRFSIEMIGLAKNLVTTLTNLEDFNTVMIRVVSLGLIRGGQLTQEKELLAQQRESAKGIFDQLLSHTEVVGEKVTNEQNYVDLQAKEIKNNEKSLDTIKDIQEKIDALTKQRDTTSDRGVISRINGEIKELEKTLKALRGDKLKDTIDPGIAVIDRLESINQLKIDSEEKEIAALQLSISKQQLIHKNDAEYLLALEENLRNGIADIRNKYIDIEDAQRTDREQKEIAAARSIADALARFVTRDRSDPEAAKKRSESLLAEFQLRQELAALVFENEKHSDEELHEFRIQQDIDLYKEKLRLHGIYKNVLEDDEVVAITAKIPVLEGIKNLKPNKDAPEDLFDLLSIKIDEDDKEALTTALDFAKGQLLEFFALQKQLADQQVQLANSRVDAAQRALDAEMQAEREGFASRTDTARKELDLAKKQQADAIKNRQKLAKTEILLNTAMESAHITLAVAKVLSTLPPPFNIAAVTVMLGAYAAAKLKALSIAGKQQFGKGGLEIIGGGSHASGNDTPLGFASKGKQAYGERGEAHMILDKRTTARYRSELPNVFDALKRGKFNEMYTRYDKARAGIPAFVGGSYSADLSGTEQRLDKIYRQGQDRSTVNPDGTVTTIRGTVRTTRR